MTLEEMKARKRELGYSNEEISKRSGVPFGTVQKIFGGKTASPRHDTIVALEKVLAPAPEPIPNRYIIHTLDPAAGSASDTAVQPVSPQQRYQPVPESAQASQVAEAQSVYGSSALSFDQPSAANRKRQGEYTIEDWENLPDDVRAELINGELYYMATPMIVHQEFVSILTQIFGNFIHDHHGGCRVYPAPLGVRLFKDNKTMVEPDVTVVCHRDQLTRKWVEGAPDLVVEILSPSNRKHDMVKKLDLYQSAGVREYWIIDPDKKRVFVYIFNDPVLLHLYTFQDKIPVGIWEGKCVVDFAQIAEEISYLQDENGNF